MKNHIIAFLVVCLAVSLTFIYKITQTPALNRFPIEATPGKTPEGEPPLHLYIFFSQHNCLVCLEAIQVLNELQYPFIVTGIVPRDELVDEPQLRAISGATFRLIGHDASHTKIYPHYTPAIYGVGSNGNILFILPGIPGEKEYLYTFLVTFYGKSMEYLSPR